MGALWRGGGIVADVRARLPHYADDWAQGISSSYRILAPSLYIFFASVIPALAFGEQLSHDTEGVFSGVQVLLATGMCGLIQAMVGGQPLLIVGVAEPIVIVYKFLFEFCDDNDVPFLPFTSWVCIWAFGFIVVLAFLGTCRFINKFTRFSGELFGMLIALLFIQQAIKGTVEEFRPEKVFSTSESGRRLLAGSGGDSEAELPEWLLVNGLWAVLMALGLLMSAMLVHTGRSWRFFKGSVRSVLADYGVPLMVLVWSGVSFALQDPTPSGVPRRLAIPNIWDLPSSTWDVVTRLGDVDIGYIFAAALPGFIITVLFYFDHNVSSQLAQQKEFNLVKPPSYHWDFLLLGFMTLLCGLIGVPPVNGVLPQAPMHTRSLAVLKKQENRAELRKMAKSKSSANLQKEGSTVQLTAAVAAGAPPAVAAGSSTSSDGGAAAKEGRPSSEQELDVRAQLEVMPIEVKEQRLSNLLQSGLVAVCLALTPALKKIPKSVLWGYFAYMALESLPGSEFWDRLLLLITDRKKRLLMLESEHPLYLETVPFRVIAAFTVMQFVTMMLVWGITWAGIVGILFPLAIMALVPIREYVLPRFFKPEHLRELDAAEYEEAPPLPHGEVEQRAHDEHVEIEEDDREKLEHEILPGAFNQVKHHLTREQIRKRGHNELHDGPGSDRV